MRIFTIQDARSNALYGVYDSLDSIEAEWSGVIDCPEDYVVIESVLNLGTLKRWQAEWINGRVFWEVIEDPY